MNHLFINKQFYVKLLNAEQGDRWHFGKVLAFVQAERTFPVSFHSINYTSIALLQENILLFPTIFTFGCHMDEP